jgi:hypothetical protein
MARLSWRYARGTAALTNPDPLHGVRQLVARSAAAFVLDPDGTPRARAALTADTANALVGDLRLDAPRE